MASNPPTPTGVMHASAPPATITSLRPWRMRSAASPIACTPVAQALVTEKLGPRRPSAIVVWPAAMFEIIAGTVYGLMRPGPRSISVVLVRSSVARPPIPTPM